MTFGKKTYKGRFQPKNPKKYNGDANNIIYRSTWEVRVMKWLDEHPNVVWWASEELPIPYKSPLDNKKACTDFSAHASMTYSLVCSASPIRYRFAASGSASDI